MSGEGVGLEHHDGEVLFAHFAQYSVLNTVYDGQPIGQRLDCFAHPSSCPPPLFDLVPPGR